MKDSFVFLSEASSRCLPFTSLRIEVMTNQVFSWQRDFVLGIVASLPWVCVGCVFHLQDEDISGSKGVLDGPRTWKDLKICLRVKELGGVMVRVQVSGCRIYYI